jgi:hypothetical protein
MTAQVAQAWATAYASCRTSAPVSPPLRLTLDRYLREQAAG